MNALMLLRVETSTTTTLESTPPPSFGIFASNAAKVMQRSGMVVRVALVDGRVVIRLEHHGKLVGELTEEP